MNEVFLFGGIVADDYDGVDILIKTGFRFKLIYGKYRDCQHD